MSAGILIPVFLAAIGIGVAKSKSNSNKKKNNDERR
jgi:hypothetical protein